MKFNYEILNIDINRYQRQRVWSEKEMNKVLQISRSTRWRISQGKTITMDVFLKCMSILDVKNFNRYFKVIEE